MLFALMYHKIIKDEDISSSYDITIKKFQEQLEFLKELNCEFVTTKNILKEDLLRTKAIKVMITFDDGYDDNFTNAFPILKDLNILATFFVATEWIESKKDMMSWQQIKEMAENGMVIESHAHTHRFLADLKDEDVVLELKKSRELIKEKTGFSCRYFSCPGGRVNRSIINIARDLDFKGIFTSVPGINSEAKNQYLFNRILINKKMGFGRFQKIFKKKETDFSADRCFYNFKNFLKTMIGNNVYHCFWSGFNKK